MFPAVSCGKRTGLQVGQMTKKLFLIFTFFIQLLLYINVAFATEITRPYQVNMIIFARNDINWLEPEKYYAIKNQDDYTKAKYLAPLQNETTDRPANTLMPQNDFALNDELNKLIASPKYKVLLAFSWWQPFGFPKDWQTIRISGGELYDQYNNPVSFGQQDWLLKLMPNKMHWQLDGTIRITLNRYLNATIDLQYLLPNRKQNTQISLDSKDINFSPLKVFRIQNTVRTRSQVTNYIDNPAFGVILRFEHYQPEEEQQDD